jgi:predicted nucleic acid-binding protein
MIYFDTSYIVRLYVQDEGWERVRTLAAAEHLACCLHGRAETVAAFHRKLREGRVTRAGSGVLIDQFETDCEANGIRWLPLSATVINRLTTVIRGLPANATLRAADGVHLACAAENGFEAIYSNDRVLLANAAHFGLTGINVLS